MELLRGTTKDRSLMLAGLTNKSALQQALPQTFVSKTINKIYGHVATCVTTDLRPFSFRYLEKFTGSKKIYYARFETIDISNSLDFYRINVTGFSGDTGDAMANTNEMKFTTYDKDNDLKDLQNCAQIFSGGWWYNRCHSCNLNGAYGDTTFGVGINWYDLTYHNKSLKATAMKVKRIQ